MSTAIDAFGANALRNTSKAEVLGQPVELLLFVVINKMEPFRDVQELSSNLLGNPHSLHSQQSAEEDREATARRLILEMCNTDSSSYDCVFTSGATGTSSVRCVWQSLSQKS